jgi:hypothetical protein
VQNYLFNSELPNNLVEKAPFLAHSGMVCAILLPYIKITEVAQMHYVTLTEA